MNKKHIFRFGFLLVILAFVFEAYSQAVWVEDFNSLTPGSNWNGRAGQVIMENGGVNNSQCVRVEYDIRQDPTGTTVRQWKQPVPPALEYTLQYDLYFESNWTNSYGGKFHGFSPQTHVTGCKDVQPHTWSARMVLRNREPRLYLYHQDKGPGCGTSVNSNMVLAKERWYSVSYYLKVNSKADQSDGIVELYIDGKLVASRGNMKFYAVDGDHTKITDFFFSTFLVRNSTGPVVSRQYMRNDNFAVVPGRAIRESPGNNDDFVPGNLLFLELDASRGSVIKSPDKAVYDEGEEVVLTAKPEPGFRFTNWTGDLISNENPLVITMDATVRLTANFEPITSVNELRGEKPKVYPNPSRGVFTVETGQRFGITVYTLSGVRLIEGEGYGSFEIDINKYGRGIYLLEIESKDGVSFMQLAIK